MATADRLAWRTSSRSSNGEKCVEVAPVGEGVALRHSKCPEAGTITFSMAAWSAFVREVRAGLASAHGVVTVTGVGTDTLVTSLHTGVELRFDAGEWSAFVAGAVDGEFDFTGSFAAAP